MNTSFSSWNSDKNDPAALHQQQLHAQQNHAQQAHQQAAQQQQQQQNAAHSSDDKFDPSFAREDHETDGFPLSVVDEVAAAAVVAQQQKRSREEDDLDDDKKLLGIGGPNGGLTDIGSGGLRNGHKALSGTKRALQNRKAQRAFRQRKEKYVKDLELKANEVDHLKQTIEDLRNENMQLRDYTLALQSRVIELSPPNIQSGDNSVPTPPAVFNGKFGEK